MLQGSVMDSAVEHLLHRLRGLCDNADTGCEQFHDHEIVFLMKSPQNQSVSLRVRRSLDPQHEQLPFHLRYLGQPEIGDKNRATLVRSCVDVACTQNVTIFLEEMGFKKDFEFLSKGFIFRKGRMKVVVAKISRKENVDQYISGSYLVELSVVAPAGQDGLADEVKAFAEQLKPLVNLEKVDPRGQRITIS